MSLSVCDVYSSVDVLLKLNYRKKQMFGMVPEDIPEDRPPMQGYMRQSNIHGSPHIRPLF